MAKFKKVAVFYREEVAEVSEWDKKICAWLRKNYPSIEILPPNTVPRERRHAPELLIVLGGDGTILEATQKYKKWNPLFFGLNLGHVGFLASVRKKVKFLEGLEALMIGNYRVVSKMMIQGSLVRNGKTIYNAHTLNEVLVQSLWSVLKITVSVDGHPVQHIHGTGVLVSTATGSTAFNLSAHGPIVMPDIQCMIVTELMDHNLPTPSLVVKKNRTVELSIDDFRDRGDFIISKSGKKADVVLVVESGQIVPLLRGDKVVVSRSPKLTRFAELEKNYFFKSLEEQFAFR